MKKFIKILKNCITVLFLLFIYILISMQSYCNAVSTDLTRSVFRLHIIANSNSQEDQELKLKIRDNLLEYMNTICSNCSTKSEAMQIANNNKDNFQQIAENTIKENGYDYQVKININNFYFPSKSYGDISLPAGYYDALRVEIGEAKGQNWWCVMFPSLCFIDVSSGVVNQEAKDNLENNLNNESYMVISENQNKPDMKFKFKLIELFAQTGLFTAKN